MKITHTEDVVQMRKQEYPPLEDFVDALYWQNRGDSSKMISYLAKIDAVKKRFPKVETLGVLKARKDVEIDAARMLANRTSFSFDGKEIKADELSMLDITATNGGVCLRGKLRDDWPGMWRAMDKSYVIIPDIETWRRFYAAIEETGQANFNKAQALKIQLAQATTAEEVDAIVW